MVNAKQVAGLVERFQKAQALIAGGAVSPISGLDGYYVVLNGDGTQHYLVRIEAEHECCSCPDFQHRQKDAGQPCKHLIAAQLVVEHATKPARKAAKAAPATAEAPAGSVDAELMDEVLFGKAA